MMAADDDRQVVDRGSAGLATRERQVTATLLALADTLVSEYDVLEYLELLLQRCLAVVGAVAGGVMLAGRDGELELVASSDDDMRVLELFELQRRQGPCIDSFRSGEHLVATDLDASSRWPLVGAAAASRGFRSAVAVPMRLRGDVIGVLNLFRADPDQIEPDDVRLARAFADMATIGILHERAVRESRVLADQLQGALHSRVVVEQAKGMLAERGQLPVDESFRLLRAYARSHNLRLRALAADLVSGAVAMDAVLADPPHVR